MSTLNQTITRLKQKLTALLQHLLYSPNVYVALVIGSLIGGLTGILIGTFSGAMIGEEYPLCMQYQPNILGFSIFPIKMDSLIGAIGGSVIGAPLLGYFSAMVMVFQTHTNSKLSKTLSRDNIQELIKFCLIISIEMNVGILIVAWIANLVFPGLGILIGAIIGFFVMLLITTLHKKYLTAC